jgi:hypothetical protein
MLETVIIAVIVSIVVSLVIVRTISPRESTVLIRDSEGHPRVQLIAEPREIGPKAWLAFDS